MNSILIKQGDYKSKENGSLIKPPGLPGAWLDNLILIYKSLLFLRYGDVISQEVGKLIGWCGFTEIKTLHFIAG